MNSFPAWASVVLGACAWIFLPIFVATWSPLWMLAVVVVSVVAYMTAVWEQHRIETGISSASSPAVARAGERIAMVQGLLFIAVIVFLALFGDMLFAEPGFESCAYPPIDILHHY